MPQRPIRNIIIVGGGTAGWLSACLLASHCKTEQGRGGTVTLIESPSIPTIGVGEGTWPTMRQSLKRIGLTETDFLRATTAGLKQGSRFIGWADGSADDHYDHPFSPPLDAHGFDPFALWCAMGAEQRPAFADFHHVQARLCAAGFGPKTPLQADYEGHLNYGYHLDAGAFASLLCQHGTTNLGIRHLRDDVLDVGLDEDGAIGHLICQQSGRVDGDFFVDCTGFSARLIGTALGVPFRDCNHILFADRAIAVQKPHATADAPLSCQTHATAQKAGWIWDIALKERRGLGHVYASDFLSDDEAQKILLEHAGMKEAEATPRLLKIKSGYRQSLWQKNCVAIGLSAGFFEPLEASALMLAELSAQALCALLPLDHGDLAIASRRYNQRFAHFWPAILKFLKLHYILSRRTEPFWLANRDAQSWPDDLAELLALWRDQPPLPDHLGAENEVFSYLSYRYVLYGMGFAAPRNPPRGQGAPARWQQMLDGLMGRMESTLPRHRDLINHVHRHGFQAI
ncbi:tryptophan halogenase [Iodidimonas nitroreducens]|uniref:Tryptophan halogenase n=1 Tax=Iodidimonas nitroreducens TaxID=1236968 RepID=A0A5A7N7I0_9PROT|nr:tryptophan halogenase family protein [Iodidimonas nitroreducens]GAK33176.1 flavin-dependent tryptophan halogenase RebH [alpha proteobacterium Q-1]GER04282.1 tryptophan halogenase [Iodidimonas nitroreducens]